jgi:hypothetical protein
MDKKQSAQQQESEFQSKENWETLAYIEERTQEYLAKNDLG